MRLNVLSKITHLANGRAAIQIQGLSFPAFLLYHDVKVSENYNGKNASVCLGALGMFLGGGRIQIIIRIIDSSLPNRSRGGKGP